MTISITFYVAVYGRNSHSHSTCIKMSLANSGSLSSPFSIANPIRYFPRTLSNCVSEFGYACTFIATRDDCNHHQFVVFVWLIFLFIVQYVLLSSLKVAHPNYLLIWHVSICLFVDAMFSNQPLTVSGNGSDTQSEGEREWNKLNSVNWKQFYDYWATSESLTHTNISVSNLFRVGFWKWNAFRWCVHICIYIYWELNQSDSIQWESRCFLLDSFSEHAKTPSASNAPFNEHTIFALNAIPHRNRKIKRKHNTKSKFFISRSDKKQRRCAYSIPTTARLVRDWEWIKLHGVSLHLAEPVST